jgi:gliding motility-associated lipoprotein GldH
MQIKTTHKYCFVTTLCVAMLLSSCTDKYVWQQNKIITDGIWNKDTVLKIELPMEDTVSWYSLSINVRNRTDYSFQNLYLFLQILAPNGATTTDTLNFILANDDGSWTGSGGLFSKYKENTFLYRKYVQFPVSGDYSVNIRQGMRKDDLEGIASVGLILNYSTD